jgi:hypothetical protein
MISAQTFRVCREGKPVPTFPDHALLNEYDIGQTGRYGKTFANAQIPAGQACGDLSLDDQAPS